MRLVAGRLGALGLLRETIIQAIAGWLIGAKSRAGTSNRLCPILSGWGVPTATKGISWFIDDLP
jgi:hypothetical protein